MPKLILILHHQLSLSTDLLQGRDKGGIRHRLSLWVGHGEAGGEGADLGAGRARDHVPGVPRRVHPHCAAPPLPRLWSSHLQCLLKLRGTAEVERLQG